MTYDNQPTTVKRPAPEVVPCGTFGEANYPHNDPSPHGVGESSGTTAPLEDQLGHNDRKQAAPSGPTPGAFGAADYPSTNPAPIGQESRNTA